MFHVSLETSKEQYCCSRSPMRLLSERKTTLCLRAISLLTATLFCLGLAGCGSSGSTPPPPPPPAPLRLRLCDHGEQPLRVLDHRQQRHVDGHRDTGRRAGRDGRRQQRAEKPGLHVEFERPDFRLHRQPQRWQPDGHFRLALGRSGRRGRLPHRGFGGTESVRAGGAGPNRGAFQHRVDGRAHHWAAGKHARGAGDGNSRSAWPFSLRSHGSQGHGAVSNHGWRAG